MIDAALRVRVRDLPLLADVGINPDEIGRRQPLIVSVDLLLVEGEVSQIAQTVDYRRIVTAAEDLALVHVPLIETFAQQLGETLLAMPGVGQAMVTVDKPFALTRGLAGVQFTGSRRAT